MLTLIITTTGLSRMQLSRVVACCDVLFFEQHRFGSRLRPPFQESVKCRSASMPVHQLNQVLDASSPSTSPASTGKKKKKKKNLFHFIKKKVLRQRKSTGGSIKPEITEIGMDSGANGGASEVAVAGGFAAAVTAVMASSAPKPAANPDRLGA